MIRFIQEWLQSRPLLIRFRNWLHRIPFQDDVERKHALLFQSIVLCLLVADMLSIGLNFVVSSNLVNAATVTLSSIIVLFFYAVSLRALRGGNLRISTYSSSHQTRSLRCLATPAMPL